MKYFYVCITNPKVRTLEDFEKSRQGKEAFEIAKILKLKTVVDFCTKKSDEQENLKKILKKKDTVIVTSRTELLTRKDCFHKVYNQIVSTGRHILFINWNKYGLLDADETFSTMSICDLRDIGKPKTLSTEKSHRKSAIDEFEEKLFNKSFELSDGRSQKEYATRTMSFRLFFNSHSYEQKSKLLSNFEKYSSFYREHGILHSNYSLLLSKCNFLLSDEYRNQMFNLFICNVEYTRHFWKRNHIYANLLIEMLKMAKSNGKLIKLEDLDEETKWDLFNYFGIERHIIGEIYDIPKEKIKTFLSEEQIFSEDNNSWLYNYIDKYGTKEIIFEKFIFSLIVH